MRTIITTLLRILANKNSPDQSSINVEGKTGVIIGHNINLSANITHTQKQGSGYETDKTAIESINSHIAAAMSELNGRSLDDISPASIYRSNEVKTNAATENHCNKTKFNSLSIEGSLKVLLKIAPEDQVQYGQILCNKDFNVKVLEQDIYLKSISMYNARNTSVEVTVSEIKSIHLSSNTLVTVDLCGLKIESLSIESNGKGQVRIINGKIHKLTIRASDGCKIDLSSIEEPEHLLLDIGDKTQITFHDKRASKIFDDDLQANQGPDL